LGKGIEICTRLPAGHQFLGKMTLAELFEAVDLIMGWTDVVDADLSKYLDRASYRHPTYEG
jgi:hypothetical protein